MEDINEKEVEELVCPKHGYWADSGNGVRLGQGQQCGDDKREQVPWEQVPLWKVMVDSASISLHHILLEGDGVPAVFPHH